MTTSTNSPVCDDIRRLMPLALYGELSFEEEDRLEAHLAACEACQMAMARQAELHAAIDTEEEVPAAALLHQCRQNLHREIRQLAPAPSGWRRFLPADLLSPLRVLAKPAAAMALILVGFGLARVTAPAKNVTDAAAFSSTGNGSEPIAVQVRDVEPVAAGQIRIVIQESRQRALSGTIQDAAIRQLLLAASRDASDAGTRLGSIDILKTQPESPDIRQVLLTALEHDDNPGVRFKALEGLRPFSQEPDVQRALSQALLSDPNPGVRTQAIDLLTQKAEPNLAGLFQELMHRENNVYIRQRCQKTLEALHASTETF